MSVTDFGFAFIVADASKTNLCSIGGTTGFIAPEVVQQGQLPTPAADIFALGAILWALCGGNVAGSGVVDTNEEQISTAIVAICRKCRSINPDDRYRTVRQLIQELAKASDGMPSSL